MSTVDVRLQLTEYGLVRRVLAPATSVGVPITSQVPVPDPTTAVEVAQNTAFATAKERAALTAVSARLDAVRSEWVVTFEKAA